MDASIVFFRRSGDRRSIDLTERSYLIGRSEGCQLRLPDGSVSRKHAEIIFDGSGIVVRDLGSSNGTYVNAERVQGQRALSAGDAVLIGETVFVARVGGEPADIDADEVWARAEPKPATDARGGSSSMMDALKSPAGGAGDPGASGSGAGLDGGLLDDLGVGDPDGSSLGDFDFDFSDDEDDQPAL